MFDPLLEKLKDYLSQIKRLDDQKKNEESIKIIDEALLFIEGSLSSGDHELKDALEHFQDNLSRKKNNHTLKLDIAELRYQLSNHTTKINDIEEQLKTMREGR